MPELPDVEGFRSVLAEHATGHLIERVDVSDPGVLRDVTASGLDDALRGRRFADPDRHGKWLVARTDGPAVLMHFGMTGNLHWNSGQDPPGRFDRVTIVTDAGELRFSDMRKLQGIRLARDEREESRVLGSLGPDALDVGPAEFGRILSSRRAAVKAVLIDQEAIAGLGNLLADEILWQSGINPLRKASSLADDERRALYRSMRRVLRTAVQASRVPQKRSWLTGVRDRPGARCPRCGAMLRRRRIAGRTSVWCPVDQPGPPDTPGPAA